MCSDHAAEKAVTSPSGLATLRGFQEDQKTPLCLKTAKGRTVTNCVAASFIRTVPLALESHQNRLTLAGSSAQSRITASGEFHPAPKTAIDFYDAIIAQRCVFVNRNYGISFSEEAGSTSIATHSGGLQKRGSRFLSSPRLTTMALSPH